MHYFTTFFLHLLQSRSRKTLLILPKKKQRKKFLTQHLKNWSKKQRQNLYVPIVSYRLETLLLWYRKHHTHQMKHKSYPFTRQLSVIYKSRALHSKSLYMSPAMSHFYGTECEIWADFGPVGNTEKIGPIMRPVFSCFRGQKETLASTLKSCIVQPTLKSL